MLLAMGFAGRAVIYILQVQQIVAKHLFLTPYELFIKLSYYLKLVGMRG